MTDDTPISQNPEQENGATAPRREAGVAVDATSPAADAAPERPDWLPEKFWDADAGAPRVEAMAKSYSQLERKLGSENRAESLRGEDALAGLDANRDGPESDPELRSRLGVPDDPEDYEVDIGHPMLDTDAEINAQMHALGFTPRQVQFVYDLAAERVMPVIERLGADQSQALQRQKLVDRFGGEERYEDVARQVRTWGEANLPTELFTALSNSAEGVLVMHQLMQSGEPRILKSAAGSGQARSEEELKRLIDDPRYWRDHDPEIVREVEDGFRRLYPE